MKKIKVGIGALAVAGLVIWYFMSGGQNNGIIGYKTVRADKGAIIKTVSSSGVVQPLQQVQVGTQVNGPIRNLYADFNSRVKEGDLIAQIDPSTYQARVTQAQANLTSSIANVRRVEASLSQSEKELERAREMSRRELISQSELDAAVASYYSLLAQVEVAKASVEQSQASLNDAQINLSYTTIKSPISGIVISRNVDEGQTVVASLSAATLFIIANDLTKMQIQASVAESDIGKIALKQLVRFTVDAYPDNKFTGRVEQIRLMPTTVSNVVTYTVIINAENQDEKLLPGMTATLSFEVEKKDDVLRLPNAALRFTPSDAELAKIKASADSGPVSDTENLVSDGPEGRTGRRPGRSAGSRSRAAEGKTAEVEKQIWTLENGSLKPIRVVIGITDGSFTEILSGISEGQEAVTSSIKKGEEALVNPFMPQFPGRGGGMRVR